MPFISHIYCPELLHTSEKGYLVGWNLENFRCCIAFVVSEVNCSLDGDGEDDPETVLAELNVLLETVSQCEELKAISESCSRTKLPPTVLGQWLPTNDNDGTEYVPPTLFQMQPIWITLTNSSGTNREGKQRPTLRSLYSVGCLYRTTTYFFQYHVGKEQNIFNMDIACLVPPEPEDKRLLREKSDLEYTVSQCNAARDFRVVVAHLLRKKRRRSSQSSIEMEYGDSPADSSSSVDHILRCIRGSLFGIVLAGAWVWDFLCRLIISGVTLNLPSQLRTLLYLHLAQSLQQKISFSDISFTAAYLNERLTSSVGLLSKCSRFATASSLPSIRRIHILQEIQSSVVFIWVDLILGLIVGIVVNNHAGSIINLTEEKQQWFMEEFLKESLDWIKHDPLGFKLNPSLTHAMGSVLGLIIRKFAEFVKFGQFVHFPVVRLIACFGSFGLTTQLMLVIDFFRLASVHVAVIHRLLFLLYAALSKLITSLWLLFRGKKSNALRGRVDTSNYDRKQLLFGTCLFSILLFLYPTIAAYYCLFMCIHCFIGAFLALIWSIVISLREFPYYLLLLRLISPHSVTHGVEFRFMSHTAELGIQRDRSESITSRNDKDNYNILYQSGSIDSALSIVTEGGSFGTRRNERRHRWIRQPSTNATGEISIASSAGFSVKVPMNIGASGVVGTKYTSGSPRSGLYANTSNTSRSSSSRSKFSIDDFASDSDTESIPIRHERSLSCPEEITDINSKSMIYLSLDPTPITMMRLFRSYYGYISYCCQKKTLFQFFNGLVTGIPSFDLQLIKATNELVGNTDRDYEDLTGAYDNDFVEFGERKTTQYIDFWKNISETLGAREESFPLSFFYATLDISADEEKLDSSGILPAAQIMKNKRNCRKILSCVIASYFFSFVFVSFGISLLFSSSIRHGKYRFFDENTGLSQHSSSVVSPEVFTFFKQTMKPPVVQGMKVQNRTKLGGMRGAGFRG